MAIAERASKLVDFRCGLCSRLLFQFRNEIHSGHVTLVKQCERCKKENVLELGAMD